MNRLVFAVAGLACGALASGAPPTSPKPSVLLVTIDTLRPDAVGWIGGLNETPAFDRLAREGFRFRSAVAPVPLTLPSHASILSGLLPLRHGVHDNGQLFPQSLPTLATHLRALGYRTAAFVSGYPLQRTFGLDHGFTTYDDSLPHGKEGWVERRAHQTTAAALAWLKTARAPWFVWVHYYDPHDPYDPPRVFWRPGPRGAYDGEVTTVDSALGQLLAGLDSVGASNRITVVTADHGEGLGEHEERTHGYFVYDSTVLVPLVFHGAGRVAPGESDLPARLIDIAPTILEAAELPPISRTDGVSLLPTLKGKKQAPEPAYVETWLPWTYFGWSPLTALRHGGFKLIQAPRPELFDLTADPGERTNLVAQRSEQRGRLADLLERVEAQTGTAVAPGADADAIERLRALGYVGTSGTLRQAPLGLPDPKDKIPDRTALLEAEDLLRAGRWNEAVARFDAILTRDPESRFAALRSGIALLKAGRPEAAVERLQRAVALDPHRAEARYALADALMRRGTHRRAAEEWAELVRLQPRRFEGWLNLAVALSESGQLGEARVALNEALSIEANQPQALLELARLEARQGRRPAAAKALRSALAANPQLSARATADPLLAPLLAKR
ncbi:MAG TPA: sulfatase-like hydrolase/transferase [Vicinamibacteria bacterium]|nr:sulfatase-like hydrolase/transferase [Vicinamibacteria bacterium]